MVEYTQEEFQKQLAAQYKDRQNMLAELGGGMDEEDAEMADLAKTVKAMGNIFY